MSPSPPTPHTCRPPSRRGDRFSGTSPTRLSTGSPPGGAGWPRPWLGYRHLSPVPLVSKICPSDTYKVWKSGQNLRVDTTLLGFDHMTWQRGNRSFVFRGQGELAPGCPPHRGALAEPLGTAAGLGDVVGTMVVPVQPDPPLPLDTSAVVMEIDHDRRVVYSETLALAGHDQEVLLAAVQPTEEQVMGRLTAPVVTTQLDTKNIAFERWAGDSTEPPPTPPGMYNPLGCPSETIHCSRCPGVTPGTSPGSWAGGVRRQRW